MMNTRMMSLAVRYCGHTKSTFIASVPRAPAPSGVPFAGSRTASTWIPSFMRSNKSVAKKKPARSLLSRLSQIPGVPRVPPGYWEARWPRIQIEAARYGLSGGACAGTMILLKMSMNISTFLVDFLPFPWHAAAGTTGGLISGASVAALIATVDRYVSLKPEQLQRVCYDAVKKDFFVERVLGGVVNMSACLSYRISPSEIALVDRPAPGFLKDYVFRPGSVECVCNIYGPAGAAKVLCEGSKVAGVWKISTLVVELESPDVAEDKRVLILKQPDTDKSNQPRPVPKPSERISQLYDLDKHSPTPGPGASSAGPVLKLRNFWDTVLLRN